MYCKSGSLFLFKGVGTHKIIAMHFSASEKSDVGINFLFSMTLEILELLICLR